MKSLLGGSKGEESQPLTKGDSIQPIYVAPRGTAGGTSSPEGHPHSINGSSDMPKITSSQPEGRSWLSSLWPFGGQHKYQSIGGRTKPRKVPVKVEPKVFFANERTFLAWLNMAVTLSSISIAILAFADHNEFSQLYGFIVLPVAICFCIYALRTYIRRASMIRRREPGPYEDRVGPVALTILLVLSILVNFCLKLYEVYKRSVSGPTSERPARLRW